MPRLTRLAAVGALVVGLFLGGNAVWQLFGSNMVAASAQDALAEELDALDPSMRLGDNSLASLPPTPTPTAPVSADGSLSAAGAPAATPTAPPQPTPQGALGRIEVPAIGLEAVFVSGVSKDELKRGPGWMPDTAPPGQPGNSTISGHRTTYGAPFRQLDELGVGDRITLTVDGTAHVYEVRDSFVVAPGDYWVAKPTSGVRLTLTTCHPEGSDRQRLVVQAELVEGPNAAAATPAAAWHRSTKV